MSFAEARVFIKRIKEKTGRYPVVYANNVVTKAIADQYGEDDVFAKTHLWYARFKKGVTDFPAGTWKTYTLWQFSCEMNCNAADRSNCLYTVPGTEYDMDVDVFNGTVEELKSEVAAWVQQCQSPTVREGKPGIPTSIRRSHFNLLPPSRSGF